MNEEEYTRELIHIIHSNPWFMQERFLIQKACTLHTPIKL